MEQVVEDPTREKNVLDLFLTNVPSKVNKVEVIPDVSDYCVPLMVLDISPPSKKTSSKKSFPIQTSCMG